MTAIGPLSSAVRRTALDAPDGRSGSAIERVELADGSALVVKRESPGGDWAMRALRDDGRAARLWSTGLLARMPAVIDHAVVGVERVGEDWLIVMRDVSADLFADGTVIDRETSRRVMRAYRALHETFLDERIDGLCAPADRFTCLSPATARREGHSHEVPPLIGRGWDAFDELVSPSIRDAVFGLLDDPTPWLDRLYARPTTLIHGDPKLANAGLRGDVLVLVDWGCLTGVAPPAVEFVTSLAVNASRIDAGREQLIDDHRTISGELYDAEALRLAWLGGLLMLGWNKALLAVEAQDEAVRAREARDLAWWVRHAAASLEAV